ncbi:MAG: PDZ domain-containing protein [candidate division KSB1 bacterium]|nr:PDZ domain-containing protein [candidate division KSB1 bacterium]MDZ7274680.1 PDZ domain-containing protein [candidate division KSB1 bacterium]MDZ7285505.1 PDZ domain-containing protein [candidate division KSB1 bacterium]MDZ7298537.1 PDZ domain-containing protein [candidate division KSB1 bacterium]MDZ7306611.1 PDZ domain-containing protein [candidate division KSB1 bacterium]
MNAPTLLFLITSMGLAVMNAPSVSSAPTIHYRLAMSQPHTHLFEVEMRVASPAREDTLLDFVMPVWRPGRYVIFDFAGGVQEFSAHAGAGNATPLPWHKIDKTTWRVATQGQPMVTVRYKVYANEFRDRTRGLNDQHGFVSGTAVFMYVEKFRRLPLTLQVEPFGDWHVTTGLERVPGKPNLFQAPNYDYFIDCPLEIGTQQDFPFQVRGKKHILSIFGEGNWEKDKLLDRLRQVVEACFKFWGDLPYEHYTFLVHSAPGMGGGTEHINSTIMGINPFGFRNESGYDRFTSLAMHEFFHTWNVKQLRPAGIHPFDFTRENYTPCLWISEGMTDYYTALLLRRQGLRSVPSFLAELGRMIENDRRRPGRKVQSLEEASFDAWIKFWRDGEDSQNREVSYYDKGSDVSLILDLEIRQRTQNRGSLDQVLRRMYQAFPLSGPGFTPADFQRLVEEVGEGSYEDFFARYVRGTEEIDFAAFLGYAGLEVQEVTANPPRPWLGLTAAEREGRTLITAVLAGSPAHTAGLNTGDELVALNDYRIRAEQLTERLADYKVGEEIRLTVFRHEKLRHFQVKLAAPPVPEIIVRHSSNPTDLQKRIYADWLGTAWPGEAAK